MKLLFLLLVLPSLVTLRVEAVSVSYNEAMANNGTLHGEQARLLHALPRFCRHV